MKQTIGEYMTLDPQTIGAGETMAEAHRIMRAHRIRHLPVLEHGRLVGVVTDGDLHLMETLPDVDPENVRVDDAMSPAPYCVRPETPIEEVAARMAEQRYGCAVVATGERILGVFTAVDALNALAFVVRHDCR